jgi:hypothetical protein
MEDLPEKAMEAALTAWYGDDRWKRYLTTIPAAVRSMQAVAKALAPYILKQHKEELDGHIE